MEVGQRYLGGRQQPEVFLHVVIEVVGELGQLPRADKHLTVDDEGRVDLRVAVLARVPIQHPEDEGALHRAPAPLRM